MQEENGAGAEAQVHSQTGNTASLLRVVFTLHSEVIFVKIGKSIGFIMIYPQETML